MTIQKNQNYQMSTVDIVVIMPPIGQSVVHDEGRGNRHYYEPVDVRQVMRFQLRGEGRGRGIATPTPTVHQPNLSPHQLL